MTLQRQKPVDFNTRASPEALLYARQFKAFDSTLKPWYLWNIDNLNGYIQHAKDMILYFAVKEEGEQPWIIRHLHRGDMPLTTTTQRDWFETTGVTTDQFVTAAIGNGTAIQDDTFMVIIGARWIYTENRLAANADRRAFRPPVSFVRFVVGGTRVAEWDLVSIFNSVVSQGAASSVTGEPGPFADYPLGIAESPIIITQNKTLLVQYYEMVATTAADFSLYLYGFVCEKTGGRDGLNP